MKKSILPFKKLISNNKLLSVLLIIFFIPFILVIIGDNIYSIGNLYILSMDNIKDFYTFWIALFGVFGITYNISQNQKRISQQETHIELQTKAERNARFAKGVELLGNSQESARIGGSYNLFFLAKEFPDDFKEPVLNILCSHIRTITCNDNYKKNFVRTPSNEIQTLLDLFTKDGKTLFKNLQINLKASYISGADLSGAILSEADLSGADLSRANLSWADLSQADLSGASLSGASLSGAILSEADLSWADLSRANLSWADLSQADLSQADLSEADLSGASLSGTSLLGADLSEADLSQADLSGASLLGANLSGVDLSRVSLSWADLSGANLPEET